MSEWFFRHGAMTLAGPMVIDDIRFDPDGVSITVHEGHHIQLTRKWDLVETLSPDRPMQCDLCRSEVI